MATQYGTQLDLTTQGTLVDAGLAVAAGGSWVSGSAVDLGASGPWPERLAWHLAVTGGATNGYDHEAIVQWSTDNFDTDVPSAGEGEPLYSAVNATGGATLATGWQRAVRPLARYGRVQHKNNNGTDAVTVTTRVLELHAMDDAA